MIHKKGHQGLSKNRILAISDENNSRCGNARNLNATTEIGMNEFDGFMIDVFLPQGSPHPQPSSFIVDPHLLSQPDGPGFPAPHPRSTQIYN